VQPALIVALAISIGLGVTNAAYARYETISSGLADARLAAFDVKTSHVAGWKASYLGQLSQAQQFFGATAVWERAVYRPTAMADISSSRNVYVDVLTTDDPGSLAAYGLEACYTFHGYHIASVSDVDVGAGVSAQIIDYFNPRQQISWSALWWEWPYEEDGTTRYERIVVFMADGPTADFTGVAATDIPTQDPKFATTDAFLATLGRSIVSTQLANAVDEEA
jgi:hypothetical protein